MARPSGWDADADRSSSRGVPIAFAARTTTRAGSKCSRPSRSIQVAPVTSPAAFVSRRRTRAPVTSLAPLADRLRPVGQVRRRLGAFAAALLAGAALDARMAPVVGDRQDRVGLRPPVPAQPGVGPGDLQPARPERERRQRRVLAPGRVGRVAAHARDAEVPVAPLVVRQQLVVGQRPVVGDAVERAHPEVRRQHPRPGAGEDQHRAADRRVHQRRHLGVGLVDRVVLGQAADVGARRPLLAHDELPVELGAAVLAPVVPVALLEADHGEPGLGEPPRDDATGCAGADDQDVCGFGGQDELLQLRAGTDDDPTSTTTRRARRPTSRRPRAARPRPARSRAGRARRRRSAAAGDGRGPPRARRGCAGTP